MGKSFHRRNTTLQEHINERGVGQKGTQKMRNPSSDLTDGQGEECARLKDSFLCENPELRGLSVSTKEKKI